MSWFVRRWVAPNVHRRMYVLSSTFTVSATGLAAGLEAFVFTKAGRRPDLVVDYREFLVKAEV